MFEAIQQGKTYITAMMYRTTRVTAPEQPGQGLAFGFRTPSVRREEDLLTLAIEEACNTLAKESFEIISIVPLVSGRAAGNAGYSYTNGVIITGKKISQPD